MTLKILLVDDEPKVLRGLEMVIKRAAPDGAWRITGQCKNGVEALRLIGAEPPDVVVTDIKMPGMDGLELVARAKAIAPDLWFIILSGYPDFKYAQQALKLGTVDYLLKPPDYKDLLGILARLAAQKNQAEQRRREAAELQALALREQILMELVRHPGPALPDNLRPQGAALQFFDQTYLLCLVKMDNVSVFNWDEFEVNLPKLTLLQEAIGAAVHGRGGCLFDLHNGSYGCLFTVPDGPAAAADAMLSEVHAQLTARLGESITMAVSGMHCGAGQVGAAYQECLTAMRHRLFLAKNSVIRAADLPAAVAPESYPLELESQYLDSLRLGDCDRSLAILDEAVRQIAALSGRDAPAFQGYVTEFAAALTRYLTEAGAGSVLKEAIGFAAKIAALDNIEDIRELLAAATRSVSQYFQNLNRPGCRKVINHMMAYVKKNYFHEISLRQIAAEVFMNESYLSDLFKRETGISFMTYLTRFRVEQAKELLPQLDLKIQEVAEMVGYQNAKYFNKVFKKHTGMTPFEFRERR